MKTKLLYLEDTYQFVGTANVLEMRENEKGKAIILDQTILYPQGGGQPTDTGCISSGSGVFNVTFVGLDPDGVVWHFGEFEKGVFVEGEEVTLKVDSQKRELHARIHSAGHIIDCALQALGSGVKADKGFHFIEGSYIEGDGVIEDIETLKLQLEEKVNEIVNESIATHVTALSEEEAKAQGLAAPPGKSVRTVGFGEYKSCGCGGTHVTNTDAIGNITIRKISSKKGRTKISYAIE